MKYPLEHYDLNHPITRAYVVYRAGLEDDMTSKGAFIKAVEDYGEAIKESELDRILKETEKVFGHCPEYTEGCAGCEIRRIIDKEV